MKVLTRTRVTSGAFIFGRSEVAEAMSFYESLAKSAVAAGAGRYIKNFSLETISNWMDHQGTNTAVCYFISKSASAARHPHLSISGFVIPPTAKLSHRLDLSVAIKTLEFDPNDLNFYVEEIMDVGDEELEKDTLKMLEKLNKAFFNEKEKKGESECQKTERKLLTLNSLCEDTPEQ